MGNNFREDKIFQPNLSRHTYLCSIYNSLGGEGKEPEMDFLNAATLVEVSGHKLESSQTRVSVWFSTPIFPFYDILFMNRLSFSCFADFFARIVTTRVEYYSFL